MGGSFSLKGIIWAITWIEIRVTYSKSPSKTTPGEEGSKWKSTEVTEVGKKEQEKKKNRTHCDWKISESSFLVLFEKQFLAQRSLKILDLS